MMNLLSEEKSLPQKISEDIIAFILEENLQPGDKLPNETILSERLNACLLYTSVLHLLYLPVQLPEQHQASETFLLYPSFEFPFVIFLYQNSFPLHV